MLDFNCVKHIHFIGVGGVSMSKLFAYFCAKGYYCTGSDMSESPTVDSLKKLNGIVYVGRDIVIAGAADLTIYTAAIKSDDPELLLAKRAIERKEILKYLESQYKYSIAVAGAHGKTTVSAMITWLYHTLGSDALSQVGGEVVGIDSLHVPIDNDIVIFEACEYNRSFLELNPDCGVVLNVDYDHPDCYKDIEDTYHAFGQFVSNINKIAILEYNSSEKLINLAKQNKDISQLSIVTFGESVYSDYYINNDYPIDGGYSFEVHSHDKFIGQFYLHTLNRINIICALAVVALGDSLGIRSADIYRALFTFKGVKRRMEHLGVASCGANVYTDYAHHPKELSVLINNVRKATRGRLVVVFQPHTYSRTKALLKEFVAALSINQDNFILPTYSAREVPSQGIGSEVLVEEINNCNAKAICCNYEDLTDLINNYNSNDIVLLVGAGIDYQSIFDHIKSSC